MPRRRMPISHVPTAQTLQAPSTMADTRGQARSALLLQCIGLPMGHGHQLQPMLQCRLLWWIHVCWTASSNTVWRWCAASRHMGWHWLVWLTDPASGATQKRAGRSFARPAKHLQPPLLSPVYKQFVIATLRAGAVVTQSLGLRVQSHRARGSQHRCSSSDQPQPPQRLRQQNPWFSYKKLMQAVRASSQRC